MKIAFQKNGKGIFAKIIQWWTKSIYYHCELVFEDKTSFSANIDSWKIIGTRFSTFDYNNYDLNNWDVINLPINTDEEQKIKEWCKSENNCFYDFIGLFLTQLVPFSFENKYWWFCSEICCAALQKNLNWFQNIKTHEQDPIELRILVHTELVKLGEINS